MSIRRSFSRIDARYFGGVYYYAYYYGMVPSDGE